MPQIKAGQITPGQDGAPKLYGTQKVENTIPFQERLMRYFKPQEFVTIKNIDDEAVYWQYMPIENENIGYSEDGLQKITTRNDPEMWVIMPGETEVVVGGSAYRALDVMFKTWTAKSTLRKFKDPTSPLFNEKNEHLPKNFNFADGGTQERFIELAYLGKAMPSFQANVETPPLVAQTVAPADIAPMTAQTDDNTPKPKTTEGAPLKAPEYADPDKEAISKAKELVNASSKK